MAKTFFLRDIDQSNTTHVADFENQMTAGAGAGETESQDLSGGESRLTHLWATLVSEPDSAAWPTGDYRCQMDITTAGSAITYGLAVAGTANGHFARSTGGLSSDLETKVQSEGLFSGVGQKLATTGSVSWGAGTDLDRFECLLAATRAANHGNQAIEVTYNTNSFADGPWSTAEIITLVKGDFKFSAQPVAVKADFTRIVTVADFKFTPQTVDPIISVTVTLVAAAFNFTANALTLIADFTRILTAAVFNFTAQPVNVKADSSESLVKADFKFTPQPITLIISFIINLVAAIFNFTAQPITETGGGLIKRYIRRGLHRMVGRGDRKKDIET